MIGRFLENKLSLWTISLITGVIFSLAIKVISGSESISSMLLVIFYCLFCSYRLLPEIKLISDFFDEGKLIICIGGVGISGFMMETFSQLGGVWPSVFWPELVIIGITYSIVGALEREGEYTDMIPIIVATSVLINSATILIDQYQSISSLGLVRIGVWVCLFFMLVNLQSITEKILNIGMILGSAAGFGFYIGMVTGKLRLVGDSFAIPNEVLVLIFAYCIIVWPWQIVSIANYHKEGKSIKKNLSQ